MAAGRKIAPGGPQVGVQWSKSFVTVSHWTFYLRSLYIRMPNSILQDSFISPAIVQEFPFLGIYTDALVDTMSSTLFLVLPQFGCPSLHTDFLKVSAVIRVTSGPG